MKAPSTTRRLAVAVLAAALLPFVGVSAPGDAHASSAAAHAEAKPKKCKKATAKKTKKCKKAQKAKKKKSKKSGNGGPGTMVPLPAGGRAIAR